MTPDHIYYARRAAHARLLSDTAHDKAIKKLHLGFAEEYERRARGETAKMMFHHGAA